MHRPDSVTLRVGAQRAATPAGRAAVADTAALLSLHGHRVIDLAADSLLVRAARALTGTARQPSRLTAYDVLIGVDPHALDRDHPDFVCLALPNGVEINLSARKGMTARLEELARLVVADQAVAPTPTALTA
ncbi:MAG TPA: hypothetical protein VM677_18260 [Actinokineospora sp.]|nr:hypothetical protein [Actinokineospora sp.]